VQSGNADLPSSARLHRRDKVVNTGSCGRAMGYSPDWGDQSRENARIAILIVTSA
jgi:hypothetical protein